MTKKGTRYYYDSTKQSATVLQLLQFVLHLSKTNNYKFIYLIYKYIDTILLNNKHLNSNCSTVAQKVCLTHVLVGRINNSNKYLAAEPILKNQICQSASSY